MEKYAADLVLSMYYTHSRYQKFIKIKMKIDNYRSQHYGSTEKHATKL